MDSIDKRKSERGNSGGYTDWFLEKTVIVNNLSLWIVIERILVIYVHAWIKHTTKEKLNPY